MGKRTFMTKKHYEFIASQIQALHEDHNMAWSDVALVAEQFTNSLETTNPLFNKDLFLTSCGVVVDGTEHTSSSD